MGYIYKITNKINQKSYIGLTSKSVEERWKEHIASINKLKDQRPLYSALAKYGVDSFSIETIEEVDNDFLGERETYWISYYDSYKNGYNATLGGDGKWTHSIEQYDLQGNYIATYKNTYEAVMKTKISESVIRGVCRRQYKTARSYIFKYSDDTTPITELIKNAKENKCYKVQVYQYSMGGELIAIWNSIKEASQETQILNIHRGLNDSKPHCGYVWRTVDKDFLDNLDLTSIIVQLDKENNIIDYFSSFLSAAKSLGHQQSGNIPTCCKDTQYKHKAYGYYWRYLRDVL